MKKRREMTDNKTTRAHIEYVEVCKTIKRKLGKISESTT